MMCQTHHHHRVARAAAARDLNIELYSASRKATVE